MELDPRTLNPVVLVGAKGNMGRRYKAILKHFCVHHIDIDTDSNPLLRERCFKEANEFIIATPTDTHAQIIREICQDESPKNILCEKPIAKDWKVVSELYDLVEGLNKKEKRGLLYCVNQYAHLPFPPLPIGPTYYNYYKTGNDGLFWDCFQIYALQAVCDWNEEVIVSNTSPIWKCSINGIRLNLGDMDKAYVSMVKDFLLLKVTRWSKDHVVSTTKRIQSLIYQ